MSVLYSKILNSSSENMPLIILHGLFGMSDNWKTLAKQFAEYWPVHIVDLRNHGDSFHADEMSLELMAEDLDQYLEYHNIEKCNLIGHSLGGKVAMTFTDLYTKKVNRLVVVDIGIKEYPPHHVKILEGLQSIDFKVDNSRKKIDERLKVYIPEIEVRQFLMKNIERISKNKYGFKINLESIVNNYISLLLESKPSEKIQIPVLFIKGEFSDYIEAQEFTTIKNYYANAELVTIEETGHWVHAQNPNDFYDTVVSFLNESNFA